MKVIHRRNEREFREFLQEIAFEAILATDSGGGDPNKAGARIMKKRGESIVRDGEFWIDHVKRELGGDRSEEQYFADALVEAFILTFEGKERAANRMFSDFIDVFSEVPLMDNMVGAVIDDALIGWEHLYE